MKKPLTISLICDPILYPAFYQILCGDSDLNIFQIILASFIGVIEFVFAQNGISMGICLNLNITGAPTLNLLTVELPFMCSYFHVMSFPASSVVCAIKVSHVEYSWRALNAWVLES